MKGTKVGKVRFFPGCTPAWQNVAAMATWGPRPRISAGSRVESLSFLEQHWMQLDHTGRWPAFSKFSQLPPLACDLFSSQNLPLLLSRDFRNSSFLSFHPHLHSIIKDLSFFDTDIQDVAQRKCQGPGHARKLHFPNSNPCHCFTTSALHLDGERNSLNDPYGHR